MMDLNKMLNLTGMVALVTGGGNGIGCGSARILAEAGADVVIGDSESGGSRRGGRRYT